MGGEGRPSSFWYDNSGWYDGVRPPPSYHHHPPLPRSSSPDYDDNDAAIMTFLLFLGMMTMGAILYERQHGWPPSSLVGRRPPPRWWADSVSLQPWKPHCKEEEKGEEGGEEEGGEEDCCCVCLDPLDNGGGTDAVSLPCGHAFHSSCISSWLDVKCECPHCRWTPPLSLHTLVFSSSPRVMV
jgi:hypothetical protein